MIHQAMYARSVQIGNIITLGPIIWRGMQFYLVKNLRIWLLTHVIITFESIMWIRTKMILYLERF